MTENAKQFCPERVFATKKKIEAGGGHLWHRELDNATSLSEVIDELILRCFKHGLDVRRRGSSLLIQGERIDFKDINSVMVTEPICMVERRDFKVWTIGEADKAIELRKLIKDKWASFR